MGLDHDNNCHKRTQTKHGSVSLCQKTSHQPLLKTTKSTTYSPLVGLSVYPPSGTWYTTGALSGAGPGGSLPAAEGQQAQQPNALGPGGAGGRGPLGEGGVGRSGYGGVGRLVGWLVGGWLVGVKYRLRTSCNIGTSCKIGL